VSERLLVVEGACFGFYRSAVTSYLILLIVEVGGSMRDVALAIVLPQLFFIIASFGCGALLEEHRHIRRTLVRISATLDRLIWIVLLLAIFAQCLPLIPTVIGCLAACSLLLPLDQMPWQDMVCDFLHIQGRTDLIRWRATFTAGFGLVGLGTASGIIYLVRGVVAYGLSAVVGLAVGLLGLVFIYLTPDVRPQPPHPVFRELRRAFEDLAFRRFTLLFVIWGIAVGLPGALWVIHVVREVGGEPGWVLATTVIAGVAGLTMSFLWGVLDREFGERLVLVVAALLYSLVPWLFYHATSLNQLLAVGAIQGAASAGIGFAAFLYTLTEAADEDRPLMLAIYNTVTAGATALGTELGVLLASGLQLYAIPFYLSSVMTGIIGIGFATLLPSRSSARYHLHPHLHYQLLAVRSTIFLRGSRLTAHLHFPHLLHHHARRRFVIRLPSEK